MDYLVAYIGTAIVFFGIDFIWLSSTSSFYKREIGPLLLNKPNFAAAGIFYLFFVAGIVYFAVVPALNTGDWSLALRSGAVFGGIAYATYDMTNLSTLKDWSWRICVVDIIWGTVLTGVAAVGGFWITRVIM